MDFDKKVIRTGSGPNPRKGANVTVNYTGSFKDGRVFDSTKKHGKPFTFKLGMGQVIRGWDVGVAGMKVGEKAIFKFPPEMAYGRRGYPPIIPPNSTLTFEIELLSFK
eukprot:gnl/Chilomastix_cuspidata/730.p3 GENE.gnl/Chilomastix_cuspidata/730~~gnl/Chilomastix_cuspidata/730.p3  ORF type:complete len:108 (+),score=34.10 gnl/Chilomastix_cuspidata/730:826-1149(+)